jgi:hypothetical protein
LRNILSKTFDDKNAPADDGSEKSGAWDNINE